MPIITSLMPTTLCCTSRTNSTCARFVVKESITRTSGAAETISFNESADRAQEPTTSISVFLERILARASRRSRFWASKNTSALASLFICTHSAPGEIAVQKAREVRCPPPSGRSVRLVARIRPGTSDYWVYVELSRGLHCS